MGYDWLVKKKKKGRQKKRYIIRSKHWETAELLFDSSYLAPFEHVTCMQMIPFLVSPRGGRKPT